MNVAIRTAAAADAGVIGALAKEFHAYLRRLGDRTQFDFTAETYLRDGFGSNPAFSGLVAEVDGQVIGYLLYHFGYDSDRGRRLLYVVDLYVQEARRRRGAGKALMQHAAAVCRQGGGSDLVWSVYAANTTALDFYERLGARHVKDLKFMYWPVPSI